MAKPIPLTPQTHKDKRWLTASTYNFAKKSALIPLVSADMIQAIIDMPVVFTQKGPAALLGYKTDNNLYIDDKGKWLGKYVPAALKGYPFQLARNQNKNFILCVTDDPDYITDSPKGLPFFDEKDKPTAQVQKIMTFLKQVEQNKAITAKAFQALQKHEVIKPWPVVLEVQGKKHRLDGLFRADEKKLSQLSDEAFLELRKARALQLAYSQMISMQHAAKLGKMAEEQMEPEFNFSMDDRISF